MDDLNFTPEAVERLDDHIEQVFKALEMGSESRANFRDLLEALGESMDFDLVPPKDMQDAINKLKEKIDMSVNSVLEMGCDDILEHAWYLSQMYGFISSKQAWCDASSVRLKYAVKLHEAGVTWSLSKKAKTLAERIQKGLTNPDKESIAQMTSVKESQKEIYYYYVAKLLKGLMSTIDQQQRILSSRYQMRYTEWKETVQRGRKPEGGSNKQETPWG